jgi:glycosyltransferase involved in cell wall biosynthesis
MTAYDVNPFKGSESGMGWNFVFQASKYNHIKAVTRKNNKKNIEKYIRENNINTTNLEFYYYDLPYYLRFWKKGSHGSSLYFYLWQMFMPIFIKKSKINFDIAHNLNFHADAFPSFLWVFRKPFIWGPINHHEKIDSRYIIRQYGVKAFVNDRITWIIKLFLWNLDPFLKITKYKALKILGGSTSVKRRLHISDDKFVSFSSVGTEDVNLIESNKENNFNIISIGRFVPLKGFDVTINSFVKFLDNNPTVDNVTLTIIGKGPSEEYLKSLAEKVKDKTIIEFISWIDREKLIEYYQKSSVFLFPSHEGAGMVVMEAMSYGLPVICFDNYGPGELIDENSGLKVIYSDYEASIEKFSRAIEKLYKDKVLYQKLSKGARERFEQNYIWDQKGLILKQIYEDILE